MDIDECNIYLDWLTELRLNIPVNNIPVISGFYREGERKEDYNKVKGLDPNSNLPQVKQIASWQSAKYDKSISLKAAAKITPPYHLQYSTEESLFQSVI